MWCLIWAFDSQTNRTHSLIGSEKAVMEMYGVLSEQKEKLSHALVRRMMTGETVMGF